MFLSINEINLLNSRKARKFCLLGAAWVLGWAHSQVSISVGVGFGQNKVTNYSLQLSLQVCVSVDSGSGCSGAWHSTRTAFSVLVGCTQAAAAQRARSALQKPGKTNCLLFSSHVCATAHVDKGLLSGFIPVVWKLTSRAIGCRKKLLPILAVQAWCCQNWVTFQGCCKHNGLLPNFL